MKVGLEPVAPQAALDFFRGKGLAPLNGRYSYLDTFRGEHARSFVVAKAMRDDVLTMLRERVDKALANGETLETFSKALEPDLKRLGWWGKGMVTDPNTGLLEEVQLGSPHRLRVVFDANIRAAHAAGRWQRIQETKEAFPFLQYQQRQRDTARDEHKPYHGLILPVDHPAWRKIFPPNGYFCGCHVRQLSRRMMEREGLTVTDGYELDEEDYTNPRSGERVRVPKGVDPSWSSNPGADRAIPTQQAVIPPSTIPAPATPRPPITDQDFLADRIAPFPATPGYLQRTDLDRDEKIAINQYSSSDAFRINEALRLGRAIDPQMQKWIEGLDSAIAKSPTLPSVMALRGYTNRPKLSVGQVIDDAGYISTSLSPSDALGFADLGEAVDAPERDLENAMLRFTIGTMHGVYISDFENEILLQRGLRYRVVGMTPLEFDWPGMGRRKLTVYDVEILETP